MNETTIIPGERAPAWPVAVAVFLCGAVLMGLEILGGRMLQSFFGSGIYVWGSIIGVFLLALSVGYFLGGLLSRRVVSGYLLAGLIAVAAVTVAPLPYVYEAVSDWVLVRVVIDGGLDERWGSLIAAALLFLVPSIALGMVSPYAVRLVSRDVKTVGFSAGTLYAVSTVGSFLGCIVTSFYLIRLAGIQRLLLVLAIALLVAAGWTAAAWASAGRRARAALSGLFLAAVILSAGGARAADDGQEDAKVVHETESMYHYIRVTQTGSVVRLQFRRAGRSYEESAIDLDDPLEFKLRYYARMLASLAHRPEPSSILVIGLGGGTIPMALHHYYAKAEIDSVELDPEVVSAARRYFRFKEGPRMRVYVRDGRVQVRRLLREERRYDIIMLDAFRGGSIPYHLTTKEFMEQLRDLLAPDGVVAMNLLSGYRSYDYQRRTLAAVFGYTRVYSSGGNAIVVAGMGEGPSEEDLIETAERLQEEKEFKVDLPAIVKEGGAGAYRTEGPILTDDYAPTDLLRGMPRE